MAQKQFRPTAFIYIGLFLDGILTITPSALNYVHPASSFGGVGWGGGGVQNVVYARYLSFNVREKHNLIGSLS